MKEITEAVNVYSSKYLNVQNDWYSWREINESKLPAGINLPKGNQYLKNLVLKEELHKKWKTSSTIEEKHELIKYYISTWGGIHTNSAESMHLYTTLSAEELIGNGKKGIASWSKAIVIHDPEKYAIYDARVAISLNCIQEQFNVGSKILFPVLSSRNKVVAKGNSLIKNLAKRDRWNKAEEGVFYNQYLTLLADVSENHETNISTIEMLLFAKAEELVEQSLFS